MKKTDILIIGAGAAGIAAAISAARCANQKIILIDRMPRIGKKLLVTGNGRCNLSNLNISPKNYYGSVNPEKILAAYPDIRPFFEELGLYTVSDDAGRIYPLSFSAASVLDALRFALEKYGVEVITDCPCVDLKKQEEYFLADTALGPISAKCVILTAGGCASPVHGSNGSGFKLAESLGIKLSPPRPALCPLKAEGTAPLDGIRAKCAVSLIQNGEFTKIERGELQFTKTALSGICIFDLSSVYQGGEAFVKIDFLPDFDRNSTKKMLKNAVNSRGNKTAADCFSGIFYKKLSQYLLKSAKISHSKSASEITEAELNSLLETVKSHKIKITGAADFSSAQVCGGGIKASEITENFMSNRVKGLFFAGEILDIWGECGGYNLHFAFASGLSAGRSAHKYIEENNLW